MLRQKMKQMWFSCWRNNFSSSILKEDLFLPLGKYFQKILGAKLKVKKCRCMQRWKYFFFVLVLCSFNFLKEAAFSNYLHHWCHQHCQWSFHFEFQYLFILQFIAKQNYHLSKQLFNLFYTILHSFNIVLDVH